MNGDAMGNEPENKNYYQLLGVPKDASEDRIRRAYHDLAKIYHPDSQYYSDIAGGVSMSSEQSEQFKLVTLAYNTLSDKQKRAAYDLTLGTWRGDQFVSTISFLQDYMNDSSSAIKLTQTRSFGQKTPPKPHLDLNGDPIIPSTYEMMLRKRGPRNLWAIVLGSATGLTFGLILYLLFRP